MASRGDKGDTGAKGEQGEPGRRGEGMSSGTRRAIVALFVITLALAGSSILFTISYGHRTAGAQQRQAAAEQAAQRRQGDLIEARLCTTLGALAALKPPPGSPADNPSRAYLQGEHAVLAELGPDVGCGARRP